MLSPVMLYSLGTLFGLGGLWYSSERVVGASLVIAKRFSLNTLVIGALFMALVTGLPEFLLSIISVFNDAAQISVGDIMSSNFIDTVVVVGFTAMVTGTMRIKSHYQRHLLGLLGLVALVMFGLFFIEVIHPLMGAALVVSYFALTAGLWYFRAATADEVEAMEVEHEVEHKHKDNIVSYGLFYFVLLAVFTQIALYSGKQLADIFQLPHEFLGATVFAFATSLPEFVISLHAARRNAHGLLMGNALGAALQQGLFSLGFLAMLARTPITLAPVANLIGYMAVGFLLFGVSLYYRTVHRTTGTIMTLLGVVFVAHEGLVVLGWL